VREVEIEVASENVGEGNGLLRGKRRNEDGFEMKKAHAKMWRCRGKNANAIIAFDFAGHVSGIG